MPPKASPHHRICRSSQPYQISAARATPAGACLVAGLDIIGQTIGRVICQGDGLLFGVKRRDTQHRPKISSFQIVISALTSAKIVGARSDPWFNPRDAKATRDQLASHQRRLDQVLDFVELCFQTQPARSGGLQSPPVRPLFSQPPYGQFQRTGRRSRVPLASRLARCRIGQNC